MICILDYNAKTLQFGKSGNIVPLTEDDLNQLLCDENIAYLETGHSTKFVSVKIKLLFPDVSHQP